MSAPLTSQQIWALPFLLSVVSGIGLLAALLGDGIWDAISWVALTSPCAMILRYLIRSIRRI